MSTFFRLGFLGLAGVAFFTGVMAIAGAPIPRLSIAALAFYAGGAALSFWWQSWKRGVMPLEGSEEKRDG